jgi:hypothetical protein
MYSKHQELSSEYNHLYDLAFQKSQISNKFKKLFDKYESNLDLRESDSDSE